MENKYDVIVAGTGASGMFAALSLPRNLNVLMITKDKTENSNSYLAQGGICTLKEPGDYDAFLKIPCGQEDSKTARLLCAA